MIKEMDLDCLNHLFSYAQKQETIKIATPLWFVNYAVCELQKKNFMPYEDYINQILNQTSFSEAESKRNPKDIQDELEPIVEAYRKKEGV